MAIDRKIFSVRYLDAPPNWPCPKCDRGNLLFETKDQTKTEHGWSRRNHNDEAWEPDWIRGVFSWTMHCSSPSCRHVVIVSGEAIVDWDVEETEDGPQQIWKDFFTPKSFSDAPPIFRPAKELPDEVRDNIKLAFLQFWQDAPSCLNKIRISIELILTDQKIAKFQNTNGKRRSIPLHTRIENYKLKEPQIADFFMALKWLGNEGSHSSSKPKPI